MNNETWFVHFSHLHVTQIIQQKDKHINTRIYNIEHTTDTQRHFQMYTYTLDIYYTYATHIQHNTYTHKIHIYHPFSILILDGTKDLPYLAVRHLNISDDVIIAKLLG